MPTFLELYTEMKVLDKRFDRLAKVVDEEVQEPTPQALQQLTDLENRIIAIYTRLADFAPKTPESSRMVRQVEPLMEEYDLIWDNAKDRDLTSEEIERLDSIVAESQELLNAALEVRYYHKVRTKVFGMV